jgi:hypothetical protein
MRGNPRLRLFREENQRVLDSVEKFMSSLQLMSK